MRKEVEYFGNLINEKINPYTLTEFRKGARVQPNQKGMYQLYIINEEYAVCKMLNGVITDYCIIADIQEYKQLYTNSKCTIDLTKQALYHGVCILEGIGLGYDL